MKFLVKLKKTRILKNLNNLNNQKAKLKVKPSKIPKFKATYKEMLLLMKISA